MATQVGDIDVLERLSPPTRPAVQHHIDEELLEDGPPNTARGILLGIALSIPFWGLVAFTLYLLS